jgi:tetratricopeptide (TPR) repeat protein
MRRQWVCLLLCALLAACASKPPAAHPDPLFNDSAFKPPTERIAVEDVFAVSDAMRRYLNVEIASKLGRQGRQRGLIQALYQHDQLKLDYDSERTRNAAEAFDARAGNCLSLVLMTAALAKELGLPVKYNSAWAEEAWGRSANLYFRSGHINITIGSSTVELSTGSYELSSITVDFMPQVEGRGLRTVPISEADVIAMFMNNRAVEALVHDKVDNAYWWAREAMLQSPGFLSSYNTLGVIHRRHGDLAKAEQVFQHVLARDPDNTRALFNLAQLLEQTGRKAEAAALNTRLARLEPFPPFHFFNLGIAAMQRQDYKTARDLFAKEVGRAEYYHEFHFWLGLANYRLGDFEAARKELALAMENSGTPGERGLYAAKLAWLKSQAPLAHTRQ